MVTGCPSGSQAQHEAPLERGLGVLIMQTACVSSRFAMALGKQHGRIPTPPPLLVVPCERLVGAQPATAYRAERRRERS
jgi:hypothetical protein